MNVDVWDIVKNTVRGCSHNSCATIQLLYKHLGNAPGLEQSHKVFCMFSQPTLLQR